MKNYQKFHYQCYYAQNSAGEYVPVSRRECFAPAELPTAENPFKQRWFYDIEAGLAVRLERSQLGEDTYRTSDTALKREERHQAWGIQCIGKKGKNKCDGDCDSCWKSVGRTLELDKSYLDKDENDTYIEIEDETADVAAIFEDKVILSALLAVLDRLAPDDRELWDFLINKKKKQVIADHFNLTLDGVRYREQRLFKTLRSDTTLKNFFEKD